jgi:polyhydroxybutyrate depolymerase
MTRPMLFRGVTPTVTDGAAIPEDIFAGNAQSGGHDALSVTAGARFETSLGADSFVFNLDASTERGGSSWTGGTGGGLSGIGSGGFTPGGNSSGWTPGGGGTGGWTPPGGGGGWTPPGGGGGWTPPGGGGDGGGTGGGDGGGDGGGGGPYVPTAPQIVTIMVDGIERSFGIILPENYDPDMIYSAIMTFHGGGTTGQDPQSMASLTQFSGFDNPPEFIEIYPIAEGDTWGWDPAKSPYDDVGFIEALVAEVTANWSVDPENIYAAGMSAGGMMVQSLALEVPDLFAGYAVVAANMMASMEAEAVASVADVPMVIFHGSEDPTQPYNGIIGWKGNTFMYGSEESAEFWAEQNDTTMGAYVALPDTTDDGMTVMMATSLDGSIEHYIVVGGGHSWPGALLGEATQDIDASQLMIEFFQDQGFYF